MAETGHSHRKPHKQGGHSNSTSKQRVVVKQSGITQTTPSGQTNKHWTQVTNNQSNKHTLAPSGNPIITLSTKQSIPAAVPAAVQFNVSAKPFVPQTFQPTKPQSFSKVTHGAAVTVTQPTPPAVNHYAGVTNLHTLYQTASKFAAGWQAFSQLPPPSSQLLSECLIDLAKDMNSQEPMYLDQQHLRLLHLMQGWTWALLQPTQSSYQSIRDHWLSKTACPAICLSLQIMSNHVYEEIRLLVGRLVRAYVRCINLAQSLSSPPTSLAFESIKCVMPVHLVDALNVLGQLSLDRMNDDCEEVCQVYRDIIGWCSVSMMKKMPSYSRMLKTQQDEIIRVRQLKEDLTKQPVKVLTAQSLDEIAEFDIDDADLKVEADTLDSLSSSGSEAEHGHLSDDDAGVQGLSQEDRASQTDLLKSPSMFQTERSLLSPERDPSVDKSSLSVFQSSHLSTRTALLSLSESKPDIESKSQDRFGVYNQSSTHPVTHSHRHTTFAASPSYSPTIHEPLNRLDLPFTLADPNNLSINQSIDQSHDTFIGLQFALLQAVPSKLFKALDFQRALQLHLAVLSPVTINRSTTRLGDVRFIQSLIHSYQSLALTNSVSMNRHIPLNVIANDIRMQDFVLVAYSCKFLLQHQLKQPFSREVTTLSYLDRVLSTVLKQRLIREDHPITSSASQSENQSTPSVTSFSSNSNPFDLIAGTRSLKSLQLFFYVLSKMFQSSINQSAGEHWVSSIDASALSFFVNNRSSCELFLNRLQTKLLSLAMAADDHLVCYHIGSELRQSVYQDLKQWIEPLSLLPAFRLNDFLPNESDLLNVRELIKCVYAMSWSCVRLLDVLKLKELYAWSQQYTITLPYDFLHDPSTDSTIVPEDEGGDIISSFTQSLTQPITPTSDTVVLLCLFPFLPGFMLACEQKFEMAAVSFMHLLSPSFELPEHYQSFKEAIKLIVPDLPYLMNVHTKRVLKRALKHCLTAVHDYTTLSAWLKHAQSTNLSVDSSGAGAPASGFSESSDPKDCLSDDSYYSTAAAQITDVLTRPTKPSEQSITQAHQSISQAINVQLKAVQTLHKEHLAESEPAAQPTSQSSTPNSPLVSPLLSAANPPANVSSEQSRSHVFILDADDYSGLTEQYFMYGVLDLCSGGSINQSLSQSVGQPAIVSHHPSTQPTTQSNQKLKSLSVWDLANISPMEMISTCDLTINQPIYRPIDHVIAQQPVVSALVLMACTAALNNQSISPLQPIFAACSDCASADSLQSSDLLRVLTVIQTLMRLDSSKSWSSFDQYMARCFLFTVINQSINQSNFGLVDRVSKLHSLMFPSSSLSLLHKNELCWLKSKSLICQSIEQSNNRTIDSSISLTVDRWDDAFASMWSQHERMSVMHKEIPPLNMSPSQSFSLPISVSSSHLEDITPLAESHASHLLRLNEVLIALDLVNQSNQSNSPSVTKAISLVSKARNDAFYSNVTSAPSSTRRSLSASTTQSSSSPSNQSLNQLNTLMFSSMQLFSIQSACQLAPSETAWLAYAHWCDAALGQSNSKTKLTHDDQSADNPSSRDSDRDALAVLIQGFESFSSAAESAISHLYSAVVTAVESCIQSSDQANNQILMKSRIRSSIAELFGDDDSGDDQIPLPDSFVQSVQSIAENRLTRYQSINRTHLAARMAAASMSKNPSIFRHSVDLTCRIIDCCLSDCSLYIDSIVKFMASQPIRLFSLVSQQICAALTSVISNHNHFVDQPNQSNTLSINSLGYRTLVLIMCLIGESEPESVVFELNGKLIDCDSAHRKHWEEIIRLIDDKAASRFLNNLLTGPSAQQFVQPTKLVDHRDLAQYTFLSNQTLPSNTASSKSAKSSNVQSKNKFASLLSAVQKLVSELEYVGNLHEDLLLQSLRLIGNELPSRLKLLVEEMEDSSLDMSHNQSVSTKPTDESSTQSLSESWQQLTKLIGHQSVGSPNHMLNNQFNEKFGLIFAPIIDQIKLMATTVQDVRCPHDQSIKHRHMKQIHSLITCLVDLSNNAAKDVSQPILHLRRRFSNDFQSKTQMKQTINQSIDISRRFAGILTEMKRSLTRKSTVRLDYISPHLSNYHQSFNQSDHQLIKLPGLHGYHESSQLCGSILSIDSIVHLIRTKTRPKRLTLLSDRGQSINYLLKSNEDLHADQSINQTISVCNMAIRDAQTSHRTLADRLNPSNNQSINRLKMLVDQPSYPVIPLHSSLGLIRWVERAVPIFDLYKHRKHASKHTESLSSTGQPAVHGHDRDHKMNALFIERVHAALTAMNLSINTPRRDWPTSIFHDVFVSMRADASMDSLLHSELSMSSTSVSSYELVLSNCLNSLSFMSMLCAWLGIGDRHAGNICLLDGAVDGRVLHLDYQVIWDRGSRLPVPEIVPFRMTGMFQHLTGTKSKPLDMSIDQIINQASAQSNNESNNQTGALNDTVFRSMCVQIVNVLQHEQTALMSFLQCWFRAPIDQTVSQSSTQSDLTMSRTLLQSRIRRRSSMFQSLHSEWEQGLIQIDKHISQSGNQSNNQTINSSYLFGSLPLTQPANMSLRGSASNQTTKLNEQTLKQLISQLRPSINQFLRSYRSLRSLMTIVSRSSNKQDKQLNNQSIKQLKQACDDMQSLFMHSSISQLSSDSQSNKQSNDFEGFISLYKQIFDQSNNQSNDQSSHQFSKPYHSLHTLASYIYHSLMDLPEQLNEQINHPNEQSNNQSNNQASNQSITQSAWFRCRDRLSVNASQQVNEWIEQAIDTDRLSKMYEGWAPWL